MVYPVIGSTNSPSNSAVNFVSPMGSTWSASEASRTFIAPFPGTISNFRGALLTDPVTGSYTFLIRKGGVDTSTAITFTGSSGSYPQVQTDLVDTISVTTGDRISIQSTPTSTPGAVGTFSFGFTFTATGNQSPILAGADSNMTVLSTRYLPLVGSGSVTITTYAGAETVIPCSGTIDLLSSKLASASSAYVATLYVNGSPTSLTVSNGTTSLATDSTHSVSVSAGDTAAWGIDAGDTTTRIYVSARLTPTNPGEGILAISPAHTTAQGATRYVWPNPGGSTLTWSTSETNRYAICPVDFTVRKFYSRCAAFTSGQTFVSAVRKNQADTSLVLTLTGDGATTQQTSDTTTDVSFSANDYINFRGTTSATSGTLAPMISFASYVPIPSGGTALLMGV